MAQDKHQLTASLPLQIMVYYNAIISLVYFLLQAVGVYRKLTNSYTNILPEEYFMIPFAFCIWSLFEVFRLYFGFVGNAEEKVPQLSAFVLSTLFPQIFLLFYLGYGMRAEAPQFSFEGPLSNLLLLFCIAELAVSYKALQQLISRQTASFFRLVQDEDDRLLETKVE